MTATAAHGTSNYDKQPSIRLMGDGSIWRGDAAWEEIGRTALARSSAPIVAIDAYPGVDVEGLTATLADALPGFRVLNMESAALPSAQLHDIIRPNLTDDRVLGILSHHRLLDFYDPEALARIAAGVIESPAPVVLVGWGATLLPLNFDVVVLADLARWEAQLRQRAGQPNWHADNSAEDTLRKYKRSFFVEWRVADRHKRGLLDTVDYVLDTNSGTSRAGLVTGGAFRASLSAATSRPFRVVPFFDPGVWGGQWMKEVCDLDRDQQNYAWCFDAVPEENSILLSDGDDAVEVPAMDLILMHPREVLGQLTFARFGAEFPIRFDFLDTMGGQNLSLQVHPLTDYIQREFGMHYTQDESYYILDADPGAQVYLGLRNDVDPHLMLEQLRESDAGGKPFPALDHIATFPARAHDHFSIPAGTVHCSGAQTMVLEISATPYIFTFKMWDWDRLGLDGLPRPVHLEHAEANIQWDRTESWVRDNLVDQVTDVAAGPGWREERTGLHITEFIEVRRHWFTDSVPHNTHGTVRVHNLVQGREAVVESPAGIFTPFTVHFAETFIVPAHVGAYTISPTASHDGTELATVTAYVRGTEYE